VEIDPVAREKAAAAHREIRRTLESEVKAGLLKDQSSITARSIELYKMKGGKLAPVQNIGPNPLLPPIQGERKDLTPDSLKETILKYGK
jgi:hypothetical protein